MRSTSQSCRSVVVKVGVKTRLRARARPRIGAKRACAGAQAGALRARASANPSSTLVFDSDSVLQSTASTQLNRSTSSKAVGVADNEADGAAPPPRRLRWPVSLDRHPSRYDRRHELNKPQIASEAFYQTRQIDKLTGGITMPRRPWMKWNEADYLADPRVRLLTPMQDLLYRRALGQTWLGNGRLSAKPKNIRRLVNWPAADFDTDWAEVERFFEPHPEDAKFLTNRRLLAELSGSEGKARPSAVKTEPNRGTIAHDMQLVRTAWDECFPAKKMSVSASRKAVQIIRAGDRDAAFACDQIRLWHKYLAERGELPYMRAPGKFFKEGSWSSKPEAFYAQPRSGPHGSTRAGDATSGTGWA